MWHLCGKQSVYTWRNKLVPLEAWVGREGRTKETGWRPWTSRRRRSGEMVEDERKGRKEVGSGPEHYLQGKHVGSGKTPFPRVKNSCSVTKPAGQAM